MNIGIIGGGIVGCSAAYYLARHPHVNVTIYDTGIGCGTTASAGIISPWLSRRRNQAWYRLVRAGARFYPIFLSDVLAGNPIPESVYRQVGTLLFKSTPAYLEEMLDIGLKRRTEAPEIGELAILSADKIRQLIPIYDQSANALWAEGGARVDGQALIQLLQKAIKAHGGLFINEKATLHTDTKTSSYQIKTINTTKQFDNIVLANAAWMKDTLTPLGYAVDLRAQKGQLAELHIDTHDTASWPVVIPEGEGDLIPFAHGKIVIGATHENDQSFDITPDPRLLDPMILAMSQNFSSQLTTDQIISYRIGTRAYTSDFAPFIGRLPGHDHIVAASGLGSTGLTAGPIVGKCLAELLLDTPVSLNISDYPISRYVTMTT